MSKVPVTVAYGDGIGPEIMEATLQILDKAEAQLELENIEVGLSMYEKGNTTGIAPESWDSLRRTKVFLKAPITTPQGGGMKSLNVTIRKTLGLYANIRPCISYDPYVPTKHPHVDMVIIRENEEDLYAGIEYRQTDEVMQSLKIITRPGSERIIRYAFEYTKHRGRKKLSVFTKDNIMKISDGLFHQIFDEIAQEYPEIQTEHMIVDIGMARLADTPEYFDAVVVPNLYGDIVSDIAAQLTGSVGLAGSANLGDHCAMFEAIHGSAPDIAGQGIANPSGLLLGAVVDVGPHQPKARVAERIRNAWLRTLEDGIHTGDIYNEIKSTQKVNTKEFTEAVIERIGMEPDSLRRTHYDAAPFDMPTYTRKAPAKKELVGIDVFFHYADADVDAFADQLTQLAGDNLTLEMISNRGVKVWPNGFPETFHTDHWRTRFMASNGTIAHGEAIELLSRLAQSNLDFIKTEHLYNFDGEAGVFLWAKANNIIFFQKCRIKRPSPLRGRR